MPISLPCCLPCPHDLRRLNAKDCRDQDQDLFFQTFSHLNTPDHSQGDLEDATRRGEARARGLRPSLVPPDEDSLPSLPNASTNNGNPEIGSVGGVGRYCDPKAMRSHSGGRDRNPQRSVTSSRAMLTTGAASTQTSPERWPLRNQALEGGR